MPWETPTLRAVRGFVRDHIRGNLPGADAAVPNSVLRVVSDAQAGLCHLNLQYLDWLALQLLADTAEAEWLDRHGDIWLTNADGSTGRKAAALAEGSATFTGTVGTVVPPATRLGYRDIEFETMQQVILGEGETNCAIRAIDPGTAGNLPAGTFLAVTSTVPGVDSAAVAFLTGGTEEENDDDLRVRVLERIRNPPMGGCQEDYVNWTLRVNGVTRAWAAVEMGIGTVTVRFMMDELRADRDGFPTVLDESTVSNYLQTVRPVAVKDFWALAPIPQRVDFTIRNLVPDTTDVRGAIAESCEEMLRERGKPGQTIYGAWKSQAILNAAGVESFNTDGTDDIMASPGHLGVLGDIWYVG